MGLSKMGSKVLIVGGAGYIGGATCNKLVENGFDVTVYDNLLYENRYFKNIKFFFGDIRETEKIVKLSIERDIDIIVLMAAIVGDKACDIDKKLTNEVNYIANRELCLRIPNEKHIIFISTCSVYGKQDNILNEESELNPLSFYAETKIMAEKYVLQRNGTILRLGTVFGTGDEHNRIRLDLVINTLTLNAFKYKKISIFGAEQWRPVIAVNDVAGYISECCGVKRGGVYILSKENITMRGIGDKIRDTIPGTEIVFNDLPDKDIRNYRVDNSKALVEFNYVPEISIESEISKIYSILYQRRVKNCDDEVYNNGLFLSKIK
ncbi:MAG: NAD(P)-dependent oxidoreductase [Bacteroidota bacterium]